MALKEYKAKRDFGRTGEPAGRARSPSRRQALIFVVQKHDTTRLHYDFRLEMDGVLKSWAVPKGFPTKRGDRRLAIQVEDHPLEYQDFEGTIPEGNYGAGTVMVWDTGNYEVSGGDPERALESGKFHLSLHGKKLKGEWTLVRMRPRGDEQKPQWLLLKSGADLPPFSTRAEDRSVLSGRSMGQIAGAPDKREWQSDRPARRKTRARLVRAAESGAKAAQGNGASTGVRIPQVDQRGLPRAKPGFVPPMKAVLADELPKGPQWIYEIKFDGVRALTIKDGRRLKLLSRNEKDLDAKYPSIIQALGLLRAKQVVLDGEVVAVDQEGRSSFQLLQSYLMAGVKKPPLFYYVFDLLNLEGRDLTGLPLCQRKEMAEAVIAGLPPAVRFSAAIEGNPERLVREMRTRGLEGLVAKQKESRYEPGRRSGAWVKFKWTHEQEFVIGGYTQPKGTRNFLGAILVGYYEGDRLLFAAKVGTGFDEARLSSLNKTFQRLIRPACPFANLPEPPGSRGGGLTTSQMRLCTWLEPKLVCQIRFNEWTRDNHLRQPVFLGLREDKEPGEVVREGGNSNQ